jgi:hypothetical protein
MAAVTTCCRYEPSLEDLLADEVMASVLRSAGFDRQGFRAMMAETARRLDDGRLDDGPLDDDRSDQPPNRHHRDTDPYGC